MAIPTERLRDAPYAYRFNMRLLAHLAEQARRTELKVLDVGCGSGDLMLFLVNTLPFVCGKRIEVWGVDVREHHYHSEGIQRSTIRRLLADRPDIKWEDRIAVISRDDPWPYADEAFDVVLSNQVIEHVHNLSHFFSQHRRVMRSCGFGVHCFPTLHTLYEWHVLVPLAHRIASGYTASWLRLAYRFGLGKRKRLAGLNSAGRAEFARQEASYIQEYTHYRSVRDIRRVLALEGLSPSFAYTPAFYTQRIRQLMKNGSTSITVRPWPGLAGRAATWCCRHIGSVVMTVEAQ